MQILQNVEYGGERPLFALRSAELDHVVIHPGESALKHVENITARECLFEALKSSKAPTNYFTPNILRKSWSRLVVSVVHLDALAFPVAAT